jgi:hypothetical protein
MFRTKSWKSFEQCTPARPFLILSRSISSAGTRTLSSVARIPIGLLL